MSFQGLFGICNASDRSGRISVRNDGQKVEEDPVVNQMSFSRFSLMSNGTLRSFLNPVNACVTGEVTVERNGQNSSRFFEILPFVSTFFEIDREALRQINIQMIDSSNLYDGLENLWLGSADESLTTQQVRSFFLLSSLPLISFSRLLNNDG